jgi:hypothetical protein
MLESNLNSETLTFRDGTKQWSVGVDAVKDPTRTVTVRDDVSLGDFMARPILTNTVLWTPGVSPFSLSFYPWSDFFYNKRVINRINNYKILSCKLNVKIVINGNPFYYGRLMADYLPLPNFDGTTVTNLTVLENAVNASQRMHGFINPTTSQGLHMQLPFIWPENEFDLTTSSTFNNIGRVLIRELVPLKHANGSVSPLTINVFCWAEDLDLSIPTSVSAIGLVPQTSEMDMKPSDVMSAASSAASAFTKFPVIGSYAMATSMVLGKLGKMAKLFGFSRPVVIEPPTAMRPTLIGDLACVDKHEPIHRLSADSRQELTIDPSVIGASLPDELSVPYIAGKESYLYTFPWNISDVATTHLFSARVTPIQFRTIAPNYYVTAPCFATLPFKWWRGTLKYRFQIVCSEYHKGRLLFLYDPNYIASIETNVVYSRIVDLENDRDFTIDVAWSQPKAFLPTQGLSATVNFSTGPYATVSTTANGVLGIYVLNELNSPNSTVNNDISINVFVSACDDFEVSEPTADYIKAIAFRTQTEEMEMEDAPTNMESVECMAACLPQDNTPLVFFGERFSSFRSLLKRYNFHSSTSSGAPAAVGHYSWLVEYPDFPVMRGTTGSGGVNAVGLANYSVCTLLNYIAPAFLTCRGSLRYKRVTKSDVASDSSITVIRGFTGAPQNTLTLRADATIDANAKQSVDALFPSFSHNAVAVTTSRQQPVLEYELPFYRPYRFTVAKDPYGRANDSSYSLVKNNGHILSGEPFFQTLLDRVIVDSYVSVGEDFQLMMYQGPPLIYSYAIP